MFFVLFMVDKILILNKNQFQFYTRFIKTSSNLFSPEISLWLRVFVRFFIFFEQVDLSNRLGFFVDHDIQVLQSKIIEAEKVWNVLIRSVRNG